MVAVMESGMVTTMRIKIIKVRCRRRRLEEYGGVRSRSNVSIGIPC